MTASRPLARAIGAGVVVMTAAIVPLSVRAASAAAPQATTTTQATGSTEASQADPVTQSASSATAPAAASALCQVWARELSFAAAVAAHDAVAFAEHVHAGAAFGVSRTPTVGRNAIVRDWAGIIDGSQIGLEWYPHVVTVAGDGRIAYSSGPALYRDPKTGAARTGRFGSVWQLGDDAVWRVVFDDGIAPQPADAAAVAAFHGGRRVACPAS